MRRPGFDTRLIPRMTASLVGEYLRNTRMVPCLFVPLYRVLKLAMKPSSFKTRTTSIFIFDMGTSTRSFCRMLALRMRVSRSGIGSMITLPGGFLDAREQALVGHLPEAHAAQAEIAVERAR